ncbi:MULTISPECIES: acyltransferase [unclassified Microbacterium]|uniref:acyltransferase family protein n=1 Tax=unclassified Microbacterium TaxID=2609290 RepID=UPI00214BD377|nr:MULTISPECIES: acyltransferase [unclassified Microbacterium]MCR2808914.1 acyltransferase [Microbacterium sp. zg.B185]WIM18667.1 acyltransferase [Microbacterium sp. zg-B185]
MTDAPASRIEWMDVLRGTSIVLVVFNHAILFASSVPTGSPEIAWALNQVFAPIRMPLMVFLSGLLVAPSLARGWKVYLGGKARRVLYPYLVWSAIALVLLYLWGIRDGLVGGATPAPVTAWEPLRVLYDPLEHLWFLYDLFLFYVIALAITRISPLWIAAAALVAAALVPEFSVRRFLFLLVFFLLGVWMSQHPGTLNRVLSRRWVLWVCAAVSVGTVAAVVVGIGLRYTAISAPFAAAGIGLAILAARRIGSAGVLRPLRFVGRDSLVFYIVHWWPTSLGVAIGAATGNGWVALLAGTVVGLLVSTAVAWLIRVWPPLNWLFSAPQRHVVPTESRSRDSF